VLFLLVVLIGLWFVIFGLLRAGRLARASSGTAAKFTTRARTTAEKRFSGARAAVR
jgi:hypothetical protein